MSVGMISLRGKAKATNSLLCLLMGLRGRITTIELRNENSVVGHIDSVDERMNVTLTEARFATLSGASATFELFYIQGTNIRFVHIPQDVDITETIKAQLKSFHYKGHKNDFVVPGTKKKKSVIDRERDKVRKQQHKERLSKIADAIKEKILKMQNQPESQSKTKPD